MAKRATVFKRKVGQRKPNKVILIIGEGQTEQAYFEAVRQVLRSPQLRLEIEPATSKSDPLNLVKKAKQRHKTGDYDHVFCVFDGDKPEEMQRARQQLDKADKAIRGFVSIPCFELWLLLHFERSDAAMPDCRQTEIRLKQHWQHYAKGCACDVLMPKRPSACENARWLAQQQHANPCTDLHHLMAVLESTLSGNI
ncbi:RloB family protein [uncultured Thiothrix sp.]|jgi:hypothetical protein|uniref:RloB family protein n=1 Tax=uncultured Thiothrix sp. TaxID=223185 RepID=UPI002620196A|nr:RloB family protein [uncultured Thiothrix sp.]HMT91588.1 RloB family protein [Thiolinea sp.]